MKTPSLCLAQKSDRPVEVEILLDGGPLVVCGVVDRDGVRRAGLYRIYHRESGLAVGPYYAELGRAEKGMKSALAALQPHTWKHPAAWFSEPGQVWIHKWIDANLGKGGDLVGGYWAE